MVRNKFKWNFFRKTNNPMPLQVAQTPLRIFKKRDQDWLHHLIGQQNSVLTVNTHETPYPYRSSHNHPLFCFFSGGTSWTETCFACAFRRRTHCGPLQALTQILDWFRLKTVNSVDSEIPLSSKVRRTARKEAPLILNFSSTNKTRFDEFFFELLFL